MDTTELDAAWAALSQPCGLPPSLQEAAKRARGQRFGVAAAAFARATAVAEPLRLSDVRGLPSISEVAAKAPKKPAPAPLPGGSSLAALMGTTKEEEPPKRRSFGDVPDRRRAPPQRARPRAPRYGPPQYSDNDEEPPAPSRGFRAAGGGQRRGFRVPRARSASPQPGGQQQQKKQKKQDEKKEEEEELPERLKGCDKELVKRIEQEVIDSGSPVTFEDVAGLADAKRSIQVRDPAQRT